MISILKPYLRPPYFWYLSKRADIRQTASDIQVTTLPSSPDHILLICIDALRQDAVPSLPEVEFSQAIAPSTWTFPSVTSTLTGKYPHEHGAVAHTMPEDESFALPEQAEPDQSLPQLFEAAGYDTAGIFGFPMPFMATRGWFQSHRVWADEPAETIINKYLNWRDGRDRTFAYLQMSDLHAPLDPPEEYVEDRDVDTSLEHLPSIRKYTDTYDGSEECKYYRKHRLRLYRAALDYVEDALREVVREWSGDTTILLFGDHGEAHWEHYDVDRQFTDSRPNYGVGHGGTPLDMVARVPVGSNDSRLLPKGGWGSLIDITTTVTSIVFETEFGSGKRWTSQIPGDRAVLCEGVRYGPERKAVYRSDEKLIRSKADNVTCGATVYEIDEEFGPVNTDDLLSYFPNDWKSKPGVGTREFVENQLEALGYK